MKKSHYYFYCWTSVFFCTKNFWCRKDASGAALPGVNIVEKGTQNGVSTNMDGAYKIKVKQGATIVF
jgi:hypothetical protein